MLKTDIKNLKFSEYQKGETGQNASGTQYIMWRKNLNPKECGVFDSMEITFFTTGTYNIHLNTKDLSGSTIHHLKKLINNLHFIYSNDASNEGEFSDSDYESLTVDKFWTGRLWSEQEKYPNKPTITISYMGEDEPLTMSIFSPDRYH